MGSETKANNGGNGGAAAAATGGGGFRSKMEHYLYSGDKKHVFAGILIISAVFAVPWFLMNRGGQNINPIKITWKKLTKHGVKDFLRSRLQQNDLRKISM
ncbi:unnamed protein product [Camellia sinensis]